MAYFKCNTCGGKKQIEIGYMKRSCPECAGMGFVTVEDEPEVEAAVVEQTEDSKPEAKKRGRPKKRG